MTWKTVAFFEWKDYLLPYVRIIAVIAVVTQNKNTAFRDMLHQTRNALTTQKFDHDPNYIECTSKSISLIHLPMYSFCMQEVRL